MKVRDALVAQAPSLALQRACQDELAKVDRQLAEFQDKVAYALDQGGNDIKNIYEELRKLGCISEVNFEHLSKVYHESSS